MIEKNNLKKGEYLEEIKLLVEDIISEDRFREAFQLSKELDNSIKSLQNFKKEYYNLHKEYQKLIIKLRWVGLSIVPDNQIVNMLKYNFIDTFSIPDFDIWYKIKIVLLGIVGLENRDKFKEQIKKALIDNEEILTKNKLVVDGHEKIPNVGNWILDYNSNLGTGNIDKLKRSQYLVNGKNIKNLDKKEKEKVRSLFKLYENLKISSQTIEGLEEDIPIDDKGQEGYIRGGVFESLDKMTEKQKTTWKLAEEVIRERDFSGSDFTEVKAGLDELKELANKYPAGSLEHKAVQEEINRVTKGD